MDPHCVVAIALRIEGTPRPARSPGWADVGDKPVTNLFTGSAGPHPGVDAAKGRAAAFDPNMGLAIAAGPIAEKRRTGGERRACRTERRQNPCRNPGPADRARRSPNRSSRFWRDEERWHARRNRGRHQLPLPESPRLSSSSNRASPFGGPAEAEIAAASLPLQDGSGRTRMRVVARAFVTPVPEPSANDRCRPSLRGYLPVTVSQIHSGARPFKPVLSNSRIPPDPISCIPVNPREGP